MIKNLTLSAVFVAACLLSAPLFALDNLITSTVPSSQQYQETLLSSKLNKETKNPLQDVVRDISEDIFHAAQNGNINQSAIQASVDSFLKNGGSIDVLTKSALFGTTDAGEALSDMVSKIQAGKSVDYIQTFTQIAKSKLEQQIDQSKLSANEKKLAKAAVAELAGEEGALLDATGNHIQAKLVKAGIPAESAKSIADNVCDFIINTDNVAAMKNASYELAESMVSNYVGQKGAATINAAIEEFRTAEGSVKSSAKAALNTAIDQYVRDSEANAALKKAIADIENDKTPDCQAVCTALAKSEANKLIDESKLSANEKKLAKAAVAELAGEEGALLNATGEHIMTKLVKAGVAEEQAKSISGNIQAFLANTGNTAAIKAAASESLQELVKQCVDDKGATVINSAIQEYMKADGTAKSVAETALSTAIDQYVRDSASNAALKKAMADMKDGKSINVLETAAPLVRHGADKLIENSNLSANEKKLAKAAVAELAGEEGSLLNATQDHISAKLVKAGFPKEAADSVAGDIRSFLNDTNNTAALKNAASDSMQEIVSQYVGEKGAATINSAIREYMKNAEGPLKSAAETALNTAIDQYVRDPASNAALKKAISNMKEGKPVDYMGTATVLARYGADKLIDQSNLSEKEKKMAKAAIAEIAGESGSLLNATGEYLEEKLINAGVPKDKANGISSNIQAFLADTGNTAAIKAAASDAAQVIVSKYVGEKGAEVINAAIKQYMSEDGTVKGAAEAALDAAIDQYVKGDDAKKALKDALQKSRNGEEVDYSEVGSTVFQSYATDLIDKSNLSEDQKELARNAVKSLTGELPWSETGAEALENVLVKAGIPEESASDLSHSIVDYVTGKGDVESIINNAKTIFSSKIAEAIDKQLQKWENKFPFLKELFDKLNIDGKSIVNFFQNLSLSDIKAAFSKISQRSLDDWKNIGKLLLDKALDVIGKKLTTCLKKLSQKIIDWLSKKIVSVLSKIHFLEKYMTYVKTGVSSSTDILEGSVEKWIENGVESGKTMVRESLWNNNGAGNGN